MSTSPSKVHGNGNGNENENGSVSVQLDEALRAQYRLRMPNPSSVMRGACCVIALSGASRAEEPRPPEKIDTFHADSGFIDDPTAFSDDGATLVYLTTDGATTAALHF